MPEHAAAFANRESPANRAGDVSLRELGRFRQRAPEREVRGDGGCIGAAGPVRIGRLDSRRAKFGEGAAVKQQVHDVAVSLAAAMAASNDDRSAAEIMDPARGFLE